MQPFHSHHSQNLRRQHNSGQPHFHLHPTHFIHPPQHLHEKTVQAILNRGKKHRYCKKLVKQILQRRASFVMTDNFNFTFNFFFLCKQNTNIVHSVKYF